MNHEAACRLLGPAVDRKFETSILAFRRCYWPLHGLQEYCSTLSSASRRSGVWTRLLELLMIMPEIHIRMFKFISWLRRIIRTAASRPHTSVLFDFLRLIRRWWQVVIGRKERLWQEQGSFQPTEQDKLTTSATLAVPLLQTPLHHEGCQPATNVHVQTTELDEGPHAVAFNTQSPRNSCSPLMLSSGSEPRLIHTMPQRPPVPEQSPGITLTPITPSQIRRNDRSTKMYVN